MWEYAKKTIPIFLVVTLISWCSHSTCAEEKNPTDDVRNILMRGVHIGDPSKTDQLRAYAHNSEYSIQVIENVLITFLSPGLKNVSIKEDRMSYLLCGSAVCVLGDFRSEKALPSLRKICEVTTDDNMRHGALIAIIRSGGKELMPFAREVFCNRNRYCSYGRFLLYEQLSPYVGVDAVRPVPLKQDVLPPEHGTLRPLVLQFMRNAIYDDITTEGNTKRLDEILCIADEHYKISYERENVLKRLEKAWVKIESGKGSASARAYPTEQLKAIRALPGNKRTRVEIKTIKIEKTVEQDDSPN